MDYIVNTLGNLLEQTAFLNLTGGKVNPLIGTAVAAGTFMVIFGVK